MDLSLVAEGYRERLRVQWHQFALVAKAFGAEVDIDAAFDADDRSKPLRKEDFETFISRFPSHRKENGGPGVS